MRRRRRWFGFWPEQETIGRRESKGDMQYSIVCRLLGVITFVLAGAFALCLGLALVFSELESVTPAVSGFGISLLFSLGLAFGFRWMGRNAQPKLFRKEALSVIGLGWILASVLGALPYVIILKECSWADAWFESASGLTTTGATVFGDVEGMMPRSLLFWRCLSQWIGGLGIVVLFVAMLSNLGAGAKLLISNESSGQSRDIDDSTMQEGAKRIMWFYLGLSLVCFLCYRLAGVSWFDAMCHMLTTVSTGGFSTLNLGVLGYANETLEWLMIVFMFLGGFSFLFAIKWFRTGRAAWNSGFEPMVYTALFLGAWLAVALINGVESHGGQLRQVIRDAGFQVISIMTTTGYVTTDFAQWPNPARWILLGLMVVGGCSGSTAGGLKVIRVATALRMANLSIEKTFRANVVRPLRVNGRVMDDGSRDALMGFLLLNVWVFAAGLFSLTFMEPALDMESGLSAVAACLFNVGPGFGQVGPMSNFAFLHDSTKLVLGLLMILGRLELYAVLVLFFPSLWKRFS